VIQGSETVFINGLPAVFQGHQVIEASGGPTAIQAGCGTVFIGDIAPSAQASPSQLASGGAAGRDGARAGAGKKIKRSPDGKEPSLREVDRGGQTNDVQRDSLWLRLDIPPKAASAAISRDIFVLTASDGSRKTKIASDQIANARSVDLHFEGLDISLNYTLAVSASSGATQTIFSDVPFVALSGHRAAPDEEEGEREENLHASTVERVRPSSKSRR
jgi:hypothetical protein